MRDAVAPTDGARPAASYRRSTSVQSSSRPTTCRRCPRACSSRSARWPMNRPLSRLTSRPETHFVRRVELLVDQRLLAAEEIHVDQQQPGLDARHVEREHAGRLDVERLAPVHERVPHPNGVACRASRSRTRGRRCSRSARCRRHAGDRRRSSRGSTSVHRCPRSETARSTRADVGPCSASAATSSEMSSIDDLHARRVLAEPAQARIRGRPAKPFSSSRDTVPSSITLPCSSHHGV